MTNVIVVCTIVAFVVNQQLHLMVGSADAGEEASDFDSGTTATSGVDQRISGLADDGEITENVGSSALSNNNQGHDVGISARSLNLGDLWSLSAKLFRRADVTEENTSDSKDNNDEDAGAEFQQLTKVSVEDEPTKKVFVKKTDHSQELDEPRVIKGFGLGLGKGMIG